MAIGESANFSGKSSQSETVDWETDFSASPAEPKKAKFEICEGDKPPKVAQALADDFNSKNKPCFSAEATGARVVFKAEDPTYKVTCMRFTVNGKTENLPGDGANVEVGKTGLFVKNANA